MSFSMRMKLPILSSILLLLTACLRLPANESSFTLDRASAALGETVTATLTGLAATDATVTVAGLAADAQVAGPATLRFAVPAATPAGSQRVTIRDDRGVAEAELLVLGSDTVPGVATLIVAPTLDRDELAARIGALGFRLEGEPQPLGADSGPCSGRLATIDVGARPLGEALEALAQLERDDPGSLLHIDPVSDYDFDRVDHLGAVNAPLAHARGSGGSGILIAVFDTGVDEHPELAGRVRYELGANPLAPGTDPSDVYADAGHGTAVAVLAAGAVSGVAPEAEIVPARVCGPDGICRSSDVAIGLCTVLARVDEAGRADDLVLSLSLGGPTPIGALQAILGYALERGVPVAAAAGNGGLDGSPAHFPAAFDLPGLVAVAALSGDGLSCVGFDDLGVGDTFVSGDTLLSGGVGILVGDFDAGPVITSGFARVDDTGSAAGFGLDLAVNNVVLDFGFPYPLESLALVYGDFGGTVNLAIDGSLLIADGMNALPGSSGGVTIEVVQPFRVPNGTLTLRGEIGDFGIGGQELWIDEVCPRSAAAWVPADFSTRGAYVDVAAPGQSVRSGTPAGGYALFEGTSFATPQVAGALALWRQRNPGTSAQALELGLELRARALTDSGGAPYPADAVGAGLIDLSLAP